MDREFLIDQNSESESRISTRSYEKKRCPLLKTLGTICIATILGAFGIYLSMNLDEILVIFYFS